MNKARMLLIVTTLFLARGALAGQGHDNSAHDNSDVHPTHDKILPSKQPARSDQPVVAMDAEHARSVRAGELVTAGSEPLTLVGRDNLRAELSPRSVAEFSADGAFRLLRGSAVLERSEESVATTPGAKIEFIGRSIVSYDHREKSSSAFVLSGEARVVNPHREDSTVRLSRYRGATLVVGEVLPKLVRQLDVGGVNSWLQGFGWSDARRKALLGQMPGEKITARGEEPAHLESTKIEDYFSSIETADELQQPDYYQRKFDDPDKVVAEANSKQGGGKVLSPEEAALISLPRTQIDLGFELGPEFLTSDQKAAEVARVQPKVASRAPASVAVKPKAVKKAAKVERGDPEVNMVLERLRRVRAGNTVFSQMPSPRRAPASAQPSVVPDPVYDYSQNF